MSAEMAFRCGTFVGIDVNGIVRAGLHAGLASNTSLGTEVDDTVFALIHRGDGADRDTGRILAMIAAGDLKDAAGIGERSLFDVLHPGAVHREGDVVLGLAGNGAGVTSDALAIIDDESVAHPDGGPRRSTGIAVRLGYCS